MPHSAAKHSRKDIDDAVGRFDAWADTLSSDDFEATNDLVAVARAAAVVEAAKAALDAAVATARARDRSWNQIAVSLGVSRQAARQRFTDPGRPEVLAIAKTQPAAAGGPRSAKTQVSVTRHSKKLAISSSEMQSKSGMRGPARPKST